MAEQYGLSGEEMLEAVAFKRAAVKDEAAAASVMREALERIVKTLERE